MSLLPGLYKHIASNKTYRVINTGRLTKSPDSIVVVYEQLDGTQLRDSDTILPKGSLWIRDYNEFIDKFVKINQ